MLFTDVSRQLFGQLVLLCKDTEWLCFLAGRPADFVLPFTVTECEGTLVQQDRELMILITGAQIGRGCFRRGATNGCLPLACLVTEAVSFTQSFSLYPQIQDAVSVCPSLCKSKALVAVWL